MEFANPLGLLGLLSLPAIVAIHMFHRRYPPMLVAGLHLWGSEAPAPAAGRNRERPPVSRSLVLELLAALLVTLVLAQPQVSASGSVTHLIAVLDNSASMSGVGTDQSTALKRAVSEIRQRMRTTPSGSRVTVILTGQRPVMLIGPAATWDDAEAALIGWRPALAGHDALPALDMASQLSANGGEVVYFTDDLPADDTPLPGNIEVVALGKPLGNIAFTAARWTIDSHTLTGSVFLRVRNSGSEPVVTTITGRSNGETVFRSEIELAAAEEKPLQTQVTGGSGRLQIDIESAGDALPLDSRVHLIEPQIRTVHIATSLPADFSGAESLQRVLSVLPDVDLGPSIDEADLVIGRAADLPDSRRSLWWLGLGPIDASDAGREAAKDLVEPYLIDKRHPLLEGVSLSGVVWGGVQDLPLEATPLISSGDRLLLSRLNGTLTTALLLNIDLSRSNVTESPDWPIFLSNLVELRRDALPGLRRWNYRLNEDIRFRLFEGTTESDDAASRSLTLTTNGRSRPLARAAVVELPTLDQTGVYTVRDGDQVIGEFAVNYFDASESDLTHLRTGHRSRQLEPEVPDYTIENPFTWLIMAGIFVTILLAFADWRVLARRQT